MNVDTVRREERRASRALRAVCPGRRVRALLQMPSTAPTREGEVASYRAIAGAAGLAAGGASATLVSSNTGIALALVEGMGRVCVVHEVLLEHDAGRGALYHVAARVLLSAGGHAPIEPPPPLWHWFRVREVDGLLVTEVIDYRTDTRDADALAIGGAYEVFRPSRASA